MGQTLPREFANDQCALRFLPGSRGHYGGLLALAAGYLVFLGTTRAAARQVAALTAQTEALRQQNRDLWSEGQQRQERDRIIATKLVASLLALIRNDVDNLKQLLDQPRYAGTNRIVPPNYRQQIYKPPLNIVWDDLGMCSPEIMAMTCSSMTVPAARCPVVGIRANSGLCRRYHANRIAGHGGYSRASGAGPAA